MFSSDGQPRPLELISTEDLIDELQARTDHGVVYTARDPLWPDDKVLFSKSYWGNRPYMAGLCLRMANMILKDFEDDEEPTPEKDQF